MQTFIFSEMLGVVMRFSAPLVAFFLFSVALGAIENPSKVGSAQLNFSATGNLYVSGVVNDLEVKLYVVPEACTNPVYSYGETRSDEKGKYIYQSYDSVSDDISWFMLCDLEQQSGMRRYSSLTQFPEREDYTGLQQYTQFTGLVDYSDEIAIVASEVASGSETNLEAVMRLAAWVYNNMDYDLNYVGTIKEASWVMENLKGVCAEYATLFMSMVRTLGFPVRYVSGWAYGNVYGAQFNTHAWTEVYLEGKWVPFDPTYGEFGYVDALHIPVSRTVDGNQSTINVKWYPPGTVTLPTSVDSNVDVATSSGFEQIISFDADLYRNEVGVDDHTLLTLNLTNPTDDYVGVSIMTIKTNSTEVLYSGERSYAVISPHSTQSKYFILHMKSCDRDYPYYCVNPLDVYVSGGGTYNTTINVKPWIGERKSYNDILMMVQEEETMLKTGLEIIGIGLDDVFYEEPDVNITVRNVGNSIISNLVAHLCYADIRTGLEFGNLLINGVGTANATLQLPPGYGNYEMEIIFVSEDFNHTVERRVTYAQRPDVNISYSGEQVFHGFEHSNFLIELDAERCENVSITITTSLASQNVPQSAEIYNVTLPPEYFIPGSNTMLIVAHCTDVHGNNFDFENSFTVGREVGGVELIFYQISSFFAWLFNMVKNLFTP